MTAQRFGEASHPGPEVVQSGEFLLGTMNPTGLNGKAALCGMLPPGIIGVSETHLSLGGISQFRLGLQLANAPHKFLGGAPVPLRAHSTASGGYSGVGFLSTLPQRALPHGWDIDLWESARVQVASFFVQPFWVQGAVLYGFATDPHRTSMLLDAVVERIVYQTRGPRFILGDFNLLPDSVPHAQELQAQGFMEIQTLAAVRFGWIPRATCKGVTRKDMIWVSSELHGMLRSVEVQDDWWPDHSFLFGRFQGGHESVARFVWRMPKPPELAAKQPPSARGTCRGKGGGPWSCLSSVVAGV